jgi:hypothetical protein
MCGIVGMMTRKHNGFTRQDNILFQQALIADALRGLDSTGMFSVNIDRDIDSLKVASHPFRLLQNKEAAEFMTDSVFRGKVLVGHNRKASVGKVINENAHPFQEDHIILVHNGMVYNAAETAKTEGVEVEVDSHVIAHVLAKEENIPEALKKLRGAFAIVWYDQKKHTLNLVRNSERPMYIAEARDLVMFASEDKMLDWILHRNGFQGYKIEDVPVDTVITFELENNQRKSTAAVFKGYDTNPHPFQGTQHFKPTSNKSTETTEPAAVPKRAVTYLHGSRRVFRLTMYDQREVNDMPRVFLVGKTEANEEIRAWLPTNAHSDFVDAITSADWLEGQVAQSTYRNGLLMSLWLENIQVHHPKPKSELKTFNGIQLSSIAEWEGICTSHRCKVCQGELDREYVKYSVITMEKNGQDVKTVLCASCLAVRFDKWSPHEQKWIKDNNGYDPREYLEIRKAKNTTTMATLQLPIIGGSLEQSPVPSVH